MKPGLVAIGALFTLAGVASLLIPAIPFICIGALIFGPIMLFQGLLAQDRPRPAYPATMARPGYPSAPGTPYPFGAPPGSTAPVVAGSCPRCGSPARPGARFCTQCGAALP